MFNHLKLISLAHSLNIGIQFCKKSRGVNFGYDYRRTGKLTDFTLSLAWTPKRIQDIIVEALSKI